MSEPSGPANRLFVRKSIVALQADAESHGLRRTLGPWSLLFLGVGCILGAGIYVMPGTTAANFAGPGVMLSFVLAGIACALTALCYAELASAMPVSGSAYTYCYASMGEVFAWGIGWLLLLEYSLAASLLAVGFSGYFSSLISDFGLIVPAALATPLIEGTAKGDFAMTGGVNVVAALAIFAVTLVLIRGVNESARANAVLVFIKSAVLVAFVIVGASAVQPENWTPFIPPNEGGFTYGWQGVFRGASLLFFAYLGFETVSTAASETRNPQKDLPFGILGSLAVCTVVYVAVAAVLTGVVPYKQLGVPDPIAVAVDLMGYPRFATLVKLGALTGLASVLLVNAFGQSRIAFAMGRDGLLPPVFSRLHSKWATPWGGIAVFGLIAAVGAAFLPLGLLGDLVSLGVALAFSVVAVSVMWLRTTRPDLPRPFKVPLGGVRVGGVWLGVVPLAAIVFCMGMMLPVAIDIGGSAARGEYLPALILGLYALVGVAVYALYGLRRSRPGHGGPAVATEVPLAE